MKIDRLLSIIVILLNRDRITAKELAKRFEVTVRTIYRDIDAINMAGIPIVSTQGNDGGFSIMENFTLRRHLFSFEDMMGVISALKGFNSAVGDSKIEGSIEKLRNLLPRESAVKETDAANEVIIDIHAWGARRDILPEFRTIYGAIRGRKITHFSYSDMDGKKSSRAFEPMSLVFKGFAWYVYGYCLTRRDYRIFKLSRISDLSISNESFVRRGRDYSAETALPLTGIKIRMRFPERLRERFEDYFEEKEFIPVGDGRCEIVTDAEDAPWLYRMIISMGDEVELVSPESVRKKIAEEAKNILRLYQT
jgi:predicted DNA-binding transcriptional regulator YafY